MPATQKSFKVTKRDKPKHSNKDKCVAKKGGSGGKGTWGSAKDDIKYMDEDGHAMGKSDPNYDPVDNKESGFKFSVYTPTEEKRRFFANSMTDLASFKNKVRDALKEYLVSHEIKEFLNCVKDADCSLYHQDLPAILVKYSLDQNEEIRNKIASLLLTLHKEGVITSKQMAQGFRKLFHFLDDMRADCPNANAVLSEFVGHGVATGYLDGKDTAVMERGALDSADFPALKGTKAKIASIVREYFTSNDLGEFRVAVECIKPTLRFEVVKKMCSLAMDLNDTHREQANVALAALVGDKDTIATDQAIKGLTILLNRVEDMNLDVPELLRLFSCLIARSVADEALPPAFLLRLDLAESDMGFQVAAQAQYLLRTEGAAAKLQDVWGAVSVEEKLDAACATEE